MTLREIISGKGAAVHSINPGGTLADVVDQLVENNCGSLLVTDASGKMVGIISERDILRACAARKGPLETLTVHEHMTSKVYTGDLDDTVAKTMGQMTDKRIRHLPIFEKGALAGMISIGDLVKAQYNQLSLENHHLKNYLQS